YRLVQQEFFVGNVDEGEFEMGVNAPEGTSLAAMDDIMHAISDEVRQVPAVRAVLTTAGGGFLNSVSFGNVYVRLAPHEERIFSIGRFLRNTVRLHPFETFEGNISQGEVMQQIRRRMRKYRDLRVNVR